MSRPPPSAKGTIAQYLQTAPEAAAAGTARPLGRGGTPTAAVATPAAVHAIPAFRPCMTECFAVDAMITDPGSGHPVPAGLTAPTAATGAPLHTAAGTTVASSAAVAPVTTAAVSAAVNTAASTAVVAPGQTAALAATCHSVDAFDSPHTAPAPLTKNLPRHTVAMAAGMDLMATVPPGTGTQQESGRGQGPGWHTLLHEEMHSADLATAPPGGFMGSLPHSPSEPAIWKTQLPAYWGLLRRQTAAGDVEHYGGVTPVYRTRENSPAAERGDGSACWQVTERSPRTGVDAGVTTAEAAAQARPPRWGRAGKGGRFGSNDERKRYYFEKSVEVTIIRLIRWSFRRFGGRLVAGGEAGEGRTLPLSFTL